MDHLHKSACIFHIVLESKYQLLRFNEAAADHRNDPFSSLLSVLCQIDPSQVLMDKNAAICQKKK